MSQKLAETKNQHYVPQFYQRNFSDDNKTIGVFVISQQKTIPSAAIKHQASKDYMYSANQNIENAITKIENIGKKIIDRIIASETGFTDNEMYSLYVFSMFQYARTEGFANIINTMVQSVLKNVVMLDPSVDDEVKEFCSRPNAISLREPGLMAISTMAQAIREVLPLRLIILENTTDVPFISSDNPACCYNFLFERLDKRISGIANHGLCLYLPISPTIALFFYDDEIYSTQDSMNLKIKINNREDINQLNKLIAINATDVLFYKPSLGELPVFLETANLIDKASLVNVQNIPTEDGVICYHNRTTPHSKMELSFIRELDKAKAINNKDDARLMNRLNRI